MNEKHTLMADSGRYRFWLRGIKPIRHILLVLSVAQAVMILTFSSKIFSSCSPQFSLFLFITSASTIIFGMIVFFFWRKITRGWEVNAQGIYPRANDKKLFPGGKWQYLPIIGLMRLGGKQVSLVLADAHGRSWFVPLTNKKGKERYISDEHNLSLIEAIELFRGSLLELSQEKQFLSKKKPVSTAREKS